VNAPDAPQPADRGAIGNGHPNGSGDESATRVTGPDGTPALRITGATKRFGAVVALDSVDLAVAHGEVLALLGDNGAGKSTLIKCISGVHRLDGGTVEIDGRPVDLGSPAAARSAGIETVYQDLALFDNLDPAANFYAGREDAGPHWLPRGLRLLRRRSMAGATTEVLARLQVGLPDQRLGVGLLSGGQRQAIAVARAAAFASSIVILDEPTAALGLRESRRVLDLILRLRDEGRALIVVSHAMDHVMEIADRAVVMRRGRKVGEEIPTPQNQQKIVSLIIGGA
jgi:D-xylose transport system ATP-binding protein